MASEYSVGDVVMVRIGQGGVTTAAVVAAHNRAGRPCLRRLSRAAGRSWWSRPRPLAAHESIERRATAGEAAAFNAERRALDSRGAESGEHRNGRRNPKPRVGPRIARAGAGVRP